MYPILMRSNYAISFVGMLLSQHALTVQGAASANLQQDDVGSVTGVRVADFSNLPDRFPAEVYVYNVPETKLARTIDIHSSNMSPSGESAMHGAYELGPEQIRSLAQVIEKEMVPVPPQDAATTPLVVFPGVTIQGESVSAAAENDVSPLRIPTVYAPFYAGTKFSLQARDTPPGTSLTFSNMTLLLPNVTYEGTFDSGFMEFFDLGASARVCFTNSILALKSCEGYTPNTYHMLCCTAQKCNILYTQQALRDLGFADIGDLEHIQCYPAEPRPGPLATGAAAPPQAGTGLVPSLNATRDAPSAAGGVLAETSVASTQRVGAAAVLAVLAFAGQLGLRR